MITFETATIADAMKKAAKVAPMPRSLVDSYSAGIHIAYSESSGAVLISATDTNIWYRQFVNALSIQGEGEWRVPVTAARFLDTLPKRSGSQVLLEQDTNMLKMTREHGRGKTLGTVPLLPPDDFPKWAPFEEIDSKTVNKFAASIEAVSWAAAPEDNGVAELSGVFIDGSIALATNRFVAARVPLALPDLDGPITIPAKILASVTHYAGDVLMCETPMGLGISPDEWTQISVQKFGRNVHGALRLPTDFTDQCKFERDQFKETVGRMFTIVKPDKGSKLTLMLGNNKIIFKMSGEIREETTSDYIEAETSNDLPVVITFNPNYIFDAVTKATGEHVISRYNADGKAQFSYMTSGAGYEAWVAPLSVGID